MTEPGARYLELDRDEACYLYHAAIVAGMLSQVGTDEWLRVWNRYRDAGEALGEPRRQALGRKLLTWEGAP